MTGAGSQQSGVRRVVCLQLDAELECLGVWSGASSPLGAVVLLHDRDRDLDTMWPLASSLNAAGLHVLSLDLPGHGLSGGEYVRDGAAAIQAAAEVASTHGTGRVAFVAHGASAGLLLAAHPPAPVAMFVVDPLDGVPAPADAEIWRTVPTGVIHDPMDQASTACADRILTGIRAWALRISLHRTGGPEDGEEGDREGGTDLAAGDGRIASPQVVVAATKFVLEQHTYANTAERVRHVPAGGAP